MSFRSPRQTMQHHHRCIAPCLIAALSACSAAQDASPPLEGRSSLAVYAMLEDKAGNSWFGGGDAGACRYDGTTFTNFSATAPPPLPAKPPQESAAAAPPQVADAMAPFARLVGGEWRVTFASGESASHAWQWGPGKHSMRKVAGASDSVASPWAGEVMYWHPGRKQVRVLALHGDIPGIGRGAGEGAMKFDGEIVDGVVDLYQPRGLRKLATRWVFDGPDKYHDALLEDSGAGFRPLAEWDFVRITKRPESRPSTAEESPRPLSQHLKAFEALVGDLWDATGEAKGESATESAFHIQSTFEWVSPLEVIYARTVALSKNGEATHVLDAYLYQRVGTGALRCLALSNEGGVYESDATVPDGGALQFDLKGYEGDKIVLHIVRLDLEKDGTLRHRIWSVKGSERSLMLDVRHNKLKPKKD